MTWGWSHDLRSKVKVTREVKVIEKSTFEKNCCGFFIPFDIGLKIRFERFDPNGFSVQPFVSNWNGHASTIILRLDVRVLQ